MRDIAFLVGLVAVFVAQLIAGAQVIAHPDDAGEVATIAVLVIVCFLIGIASGRRSILQLWTRRRCARVISPTPSRTRRCSTWRPP